MRILLAIALARKRSSAGKRWGWPRPCRAFASASASKFRARKSSTVLDDGRATPSAGAATLAEIPSMLPAPASSLGSALKSPATAKGPCSARTARPYLGKGAEVEL